MLDFGVEGLKLDAEDFEFEPYELPLDLELLPYEEPLLFEELPWEDDPELRDELP